MKAMAKIVQMVHEGWCFGHIDQVWASLLWTRKLKLGKWKNILGFTKICRWSWDYRPGQEEGKGGWWLHGTCLTHPSVWHSLPQLCHMHPGKKWAIFTGSLWPPLRVTWQGRVSLSLSTKGAANSGYYLSTRWSMYYTQHTSLSA